MARMLVIAPHPDDEVLGVGGTIARAVAEGDDVYVVLVTRASPDHFDPDLIRRGREEAVRAHRFLGVRETVALDIPAAAVDTVPHREVNAQLREVLQGIEPDEVYLPFVGDMHLDHQLVFQSSLVAARPNSRYRPRAIYAYETLSETNWNAPYLAPAFQPNVFVDVTDYIEKKIEAMRMYASQIKPFPHERSAEALRALATLRGVTVGVRAAEAFVQIRQIR